MISIYPTMIEAVNEHGDIEFKLETFDEHCATLNINNKLVDNNNLDELFTAIREAVKKLELKSDD